MPAKTPPLRKDDDGTAPLEPRGGSTAAAPPATEALAAPLADPAAPHADGYELLEQLGSGSYGEVYKARELATGKEVAVKFFTCRAGARWQLLLEEVAQHARLDGVRGIVDLKRVVADASPPYYVMAYADNGSLARRLEAGPLPPTDAVRLFRECAEALAYVHAKGVCHCDLKPGNILLDARGHALLADFGQAHLSTDASPALGTFFYMAPDQARLDEALPDTRWDVYALGAVLYALLTGGPPRDAEAARQQLAATTGLANRLACYRDCIAAAAPPIGHRRCGIDADLVAIIDRCLEVRPERRFHDADAVLAALRRRRQRRRRRPLLVFGLLAALAVLGVTALATVHHDRQAVHSYQADLALQQAEGNRTSASLVAQAVEERLLDRIRRLEQAHTAELVEATRDRRAARLELLLRGLLTVNGRPSTRLAEATVCDAQGRLLAQVRVHPPHDGAPARLEPIDVQRNGGPFPQYSWRDWFSGGGDRYDDPQRTYPPVRRTHLSAPYVSSQGERPMFLSVSLPIRPPGDAAAPVGVLEAAFRLQVLTQWLHRANVARGGFVVLYDTRHHIVYHRDERHKPVFGKAAQPALASAEAARVFGGRAGTLEAFTDPLDGREYVAGYARLPQVGWLAVVQHDRAELLRPVRALSDRLAWVSWQSFGLVALLLSGLWAWLYWVVRRDERLE